MSKTIIGVQLNERVPDAVKFQAILSSYGCSIKTRLGLHDSDGASCSRSGLILLEFVENADEEVKKFEQEINAMGDVVIQKMMF